ncbi:MAG: ice-binding family protein [Planctomycetes bacterium]|nr:ice-binding family protein [Planctomycetota bacterium]
MSILKTCAFAITTLVLVTAIAGCKNDDSKNGSSKSGGVKPTVLSTFPASDAVNVAINTNIIARFSEAMDDATLTPANFTVQGPGTTSVVGTVSYDALNHSADFLPTSSLPASTLFTATLSTAVKDANGDSLASVYSWSFTTGTTSDSSAPVVTAVNPADLSTSVSINQNVTATFSEQMDSATLNSVSFTLMDGAASIPGEVLCPGTTATFNPTGNLPAGVTITARITTAAKDLANNPLFADYVWSFQTGTTVSNGPAAVNLGTAANYTILAKSTVTTTGATAVTGDVGLSPAAASFFTGFGETLDASGEFSTSSSVPGGRMYAATYAPPTPSIMTTAVLDMQTAYDDANGRLLPDELNLGAGNIQGMNLAPGLYKWDTGVSIPSSVTLTGGANDVWIFQIAQDLTVGNGAIVTLAGALPKNIFWQVAGQVTLGTTSDFKGVILCKTQIVMETNSVMLGRALAQTAVTLDATAITEP